MNGTYERVLQSLPVAYHADAVGASGVTYQSHSVGC